jgi:hypothetical protein
MSTWPDRPCTAAHVTARQARDASKYLSVAPDHVLSCTLAVLNIVPPEQKNGGSIADDPINLAHWLGMLHIVDLIC